MKGQSRRNGGRKRRPSRTWHRWLGLIVLVPLLFVTTTGVMLNHANSLGWDERRVSGDWLLGRYGMALKGDPVTFAVGDRFVSEWGGQLYWDGTAIDSGGLLIGAVELEHGVALVTPRTVRVCDRNGALIEVMGEESLPEGRIHRVGLTGDNRLVLGVAGGGIWRFSQDLLEFAAAEDAAVRWAQPVESPESLRRTMKHAYRGQGLTWSRVLVDLHTGRLFGGLGRWVVDVTTVLVVFLSFTGLLVGFRVLRAGARETRYD